MSTGPVPSGLRALEEAWGGIGVATLPFDTSREDDRQQHHGSGKHSDSDEELAPYAPESHGCASMNARSVSDQRWESAPEARWPFSLSSST